ncbi:hypothetical protein ACFU7Y_23035 [Kitasatospora sp. NPDC057542]|uniref:hypothetical protein n=1 Tax=Kitasatospora sp. NPDC057542 TaxID=3346162 RepID=UPI0036D0B131
MKSTLIGRMVIAVAAAAVLGAAGLAVSSTQSPTSPSSQVVAGDHFILTISTAK